METDVDVGKLSLAQILRRLRAEKYLSQKAVSEGTGITQGVLSKIESGRTERPHKGTLEKLARFYDTSIPLKKNGVTEWIGEAEEMQDDGNNGDYEG